MYNYEDEKVKLFTPEKTSLLFAIRDQVPRMIKISGACTMEKASSLPSGVGAATNWEMMACIDYLVELGEIREVKQSHPHPTNHRIFMARVV